MSAKQNSIAVGPNNGSTDGFLLVRILTLLFLLLGPMAGLAQGVLSSGEMAHGNIAVPGQSDMWTFAASAGDSIIVRAGDVGGTNTLWPYVRLYGPNGALLDSHYNSVFAEVSFRATNSGTFTVVVSDTDTSTGLYRLTLAKTGDPILVSAGDEGGPLTNHVMHTGYISHGDLDVWSFSATAGDSFIVRMGDVGGTNTLWPYVRLYGPNGALLDSHYNSVFAEVSFRGTNSGVFTVVVSDTDTSTGSYRLTLAKTGDPITVSAGDEGGALSGGLHDGALPAGDLDVWTFSACAGEPIQISATELISGSALSPWVRLYGRDGALLNSVSHSTTAVINRSAPVSGTYTVVICDAGSAASGHDLYRLTTPGLRAGAKLCQPLRTPAGLAHSGVGGTAGASFVVLATTDITTPAALWTPILTNQFGAFGEFSFTNALDLNQPQQYFRLLIP